MAEIWYLVTSLPHIMGSVFGPIRFLLPVCWFCWFLYTFNIHLYMHIFLSNYWWQESDIWSQVSYRYPISWEAFFDPSDSYFCLPTLLIFIHIEHTFWICTFLVAFFSATIDGRNLIFGHKLYIGTPYRGKRFLTCQISTSCLPKSWGIIQFILFVLVFFSCYTPTHREGAILQSPCPSVHTFVTDISASTLRNDFIFHIWLWHGDLYRVSFFQVYRTSTSCLPCDLQMNEWRYS
jgi:hypothetical protein